MFGRLMPMEPLIYSSNLIICSHPADLLKCHWSSWCGNDSADKFFRVGIRREEETDTA